MRLPLFGCLCGAWGGFSFTLVIFFSHRAHGGHGGFKRTVSSPQNAFGIQSSQSVTANVGTNKGHNEAYILFIGVSW